MSEAVSGHDVQQLGSQAISVVGDSWRGQSATICKLAMALAKAQGEFEDIEKTSNVDIQIKDGGRSYNFDYAPLDVILKIVRPVLAKHGLVVMQPVYSDGANDLIIETLLLHESGEFMRSCVPMIYSADPKSLGSLITYLRRYFLKAMLGIEGKSEDDDGSAAQGDTVKGYRDRQPQQQRSQASAPRPSAPAPSPSAKTEAPPVAGMTDVQYKRIGELGQELGYSAPAFKDRVKEVTGSVWSRSTLSEASAQKLIAALEGERDQQGAA